MGIIAFGFVIATVVTVYLLARHQQRNRGPVLPEKEWWKLHGGPSIRPGSYHDRRYERWH